MVNNPEEISFVCKCILNNFNIFNSIDPKLQEFIPKIKETTSDKDNERYSIYCKEIKKLLKTAKITIKDDLEFDQPLKDEINNKFKGLIRTLSTPSVYETKEEYIKDTARLFFYLSHYNNSSYWEIAYSLLEMVIYL